jgi:hypothetical protein
MLGSAAAPAALQPGDAGVSSSARGAARPLSAKRLVAGMEEVEDAGTQRACLPAELVQEVERANEERLQELQVRRLESQAPMDNASWRKPQLQ